MIQSIASHHHINWMVNNIVKNNDLIEMIKISGWKMALNWFKLNQNWLYGL